MAESIFTAEGYIRPALLLAAYRGGLFPMSLDESGEIGWFSPDPRGIIPLHAFHVPKSLERVVKQGKFEIRFDTAFSEVIAGCADRDSTWISDRIQTSYEKLFDLGYAHSVETWREGRLVGGLYGISLAGAFFGESMFSRETDASKVALVALVRHLRSRGFRLLDTQWSTPHLERFGCADLPRDEYLVLLDQALKTDTAF